MCPGGSGRGSSAQTSAAVTVAALPGRRVCLQPWQQPGDEGKGKPPGSQLSTLLSTAGGGEAELSPEAFWGQRRAMERGSSFLPGCALLFPCATPRASLTLFYTI